MQLEAKRNSNENCSISESGTKKHFKLKHLICDGPHLVRWLHGYELFPHCDQEEPDGREHEFPYRDFGSITWLNNNYTGGQIYYPNLDNYSPEMKT